MGSSTGLSAAELALVTAGKPMLIASNAIADPVTDPRWNNGVTGSFAGEDDRTDPQYPTAFVYDGHGHLRSRPASSELPIISGSDSVWRLLFRIDPDLEFDVAAVIGHNLGTIGSLFTVTLQVADNTDFTGNTAIAFWSGITSDDRLVSVALDDVGSPSGARRYVGYSYGRLIIRRVGSTVAWLPQIGEVILGRRRHLLWAPNEPYSPNDEAGSSSEVVTESGAHIGYESFSGQRSISANFWPDTAAEHTTIRTWFRESGNGNKHFLFLENPASSPAATTYLVRLTNPSRLAFPYTGPTVREWNLEALEVPPFVSEEE